jgi:hypothetical protein
MSDPFLFIEPVRSQHGRSDQHLRLPVASTLGGRAPPRLRLMRVITYILLFL